MSNSSRTTDDQDPEHTEFDSADRDLFEGVRSRDPAAWEIFVRRFGPVVREAARRAGLEAEHLDDAEQATWTVLLRHAAQIREPRSIPAWVITTATREAWRVGRRRGHERSIVGHRQRSLGLAEEAPAADEGPARLEQIQLVRDGLAGLDERCGALLRALFLEREQPAYEDLAAQLGIAVGSIGPTRQRCLGRLAAILARRGVDLDES